VAVRKITMSISISPEQRLAIGKLAKKKKVPVSELVCEAIESYLSEIKREAQ